MISLKDKFDEKGISPVIGVVLLVALVVALIALVSIVVFNIGSDSSTDSADASIDFSQTSSGVSVQVVSNSNVDEFIIKGPDDFEETLSGSVGSSTNLIGPEGQYNVIAVLEEGEEQVLLTENVQGLDYSGVFVVRQDEEEDEVEAELRQQFDNVDEYSISLEPSDEEDDTSLVGTTHTYDEGLLSQELVNEEEDIVEERLELLQIATDEGLDNIDNAEDVENLFTVGEIIRVHELVNLCPGDNLILEDDETQDELTSEEVIVDTGCDDLRKVAKYINNEITAVEIFFAENDEDYFVLDMDAVERPQLPTQSAEPPEGEEGTTVIATVINEDTDEELEGATVHVGDKINQTNETGEAKFENVIEEEIEAVAYKDGFQPSSVDDIDIINPEDNPQDVELKLKPTDDLDEPSEVEDSEDGDRFAISGGSATIGGFATRGGGSIGGGIGGSFIGGGGSFYGAGGVGTGPSTTTLGASSPSSPSDDVETTVRESERVFNVQQIDDNLIPEGEEFTVDTTVTSNGEANEDTVEIYVIGEDDDFDSPTAEDEVFVPENPETVTSSQDLSIDEEGDYTVYVSLDSVDEYQVAGNVEVYPEERQSASLSVNTEDYEIEDGDDDLSKESVTITIDENNIDGAESGTIDIFKNGERLVTEVVDSGNELEYTYEFEESKYAQFHIGLQESQSVSLLDTLTIYELAEGADDISEFDVEAEIINCPDEEDSDTASQFDCEVDIEGENTVEFGVEEENFELDESSDNVDEGDELKLTKEWRFGDGTTKPVDDFDEPVEHTFDENNVHLVELVVDGEFDGGEYNTRDTFVVNAVPNPDELGTKIESTDVDETNVTVNIENDRKTEDEDVTIEFVNKSSGDDVHTDDLTVNSDSNIEYRKTIEDVSDYTDKEVEEGDTIDFEVRLTNEDDTTFVDSGEETITESATLTVPDEEIDASVSGSVEICEEDCD